MNKYQKFVAKLVAGLALLLTGVNSYAVSVYDAITAQVSFTDLTAAMGVIYAGVVVVGLFMIGGDMITRKLGWKK